MSSKKRLYVHRMEARRLALTRRENRRVLLGPCANGDNPRTQHMCEIMSVIQNQIHAGPLLKRVGFLSRVGLQTVHYVERN